MKSAVFVEVVMFYNNVVTKKINPRKVIVDDDALYDLECVIAQEDPETYTYNDTTEDSEGFAYLGTGTFEEQTVHLFYADTDVFKEKQVFMLESS